MSEIPPATLAALNAGELETANLVELLALDQRALLAVVLKEMGLSRTQDDIEGDLQQLAKPTAVSLMRTIGMALARHVPVSGAARSTYSRLSRHRSDVVRCWAAYIAPAAEGSDLAAKLAATRPFASDPHFGVREIAWMTIRPAITQDLEPAVELLATWTAESEDGLRRCASEATRPRGVWCNHIARLKTEPELARSILEPLRSDGSLYVRNSVGNWLNDAGKTAPNWVAEVCRRWSRQSKTAETAYIVKKALRSFPDEA